MDVDSIAEIVVGWFIKTALDWIAERWNAGGHMEDAGLKRSARRSLMGMVASVVLVAYGVVFLVAIAEHPVASGADAVAAALAVALVGAAGATFKKRRAQWKTARAMIESLKHRPTPPAAPPRPPFARP